MTIKFEFRPGQPTKFSAETTEKIIEGVEKVLVLGQVAAWAQITRQTLYNWLNQGKEDIGKGLWSEHAQFFYKVKGKQCEEVAKLQLHIRNAIPNWQSQAWLLERCFREDFGADAGIINDLLEKCTKLESEFKKMNERGL